MSEHRNQHSFIWHYVLQRSPERWRGVDTIRSAVHPRSGSCLLHQRVFRIFIRLLYWRSRWFVLSLHLLCLIIFDSISRRTYREYDGWRQGNRLFEGESGCRRGFHHYPAFLRRGSIFALAGKNTVKRWLVSGCSLEANTKPFRRNHHSSYSRDYAHSNVCLFCPPHKIMRDPSSCLYQWRSRSNKCRWSMMEMQLDRSIYETAWRPTCQGLWRQVGCPNDSTITFGRRHSRLPFLHP